MSECCSRWQLNKIHRAERTNRINRHTWYYWGIDGWCNRDGTRVAERWAWPYDTIRHSSMQPHTHNTHTQKAGKQYGRMGTTIGIIHNLIATVIYCNWVQLQVVNSVWLYIMLCLYSTKMLLKYSHRWPPDYSRTTELAMTTILYLCLRIGCNGCNALVGICWSGTHTHTSHKHAKQAPTPNAPPRDSTESMRNKYKFLWVLAVVFQKGWSIVNAVHFDTPRGMRLVRTAGGLHCPPINCPSSPDDSKAFSVHIQHMIPHPTGLRAKLAIRHT